MILTMLWISVPHRAECENDAPARAKELNNRGTAAYELGNYPEAIDRFTEAYKEYPDARILFNLAQAYRKKHDYSRALELYRNYLRSLPDNLAGRTAAAPVEKLVADLENLLVTQKAAELQPPQGISPTSPPPPTPVVLPPPPVVTRIEEARPWYSNSAGWWLVGGGAAALGTGGIFLISASSREDEFRTAPESAKPGIKSDADTRRNIGIVSAIGGALAIAGGITIFAVSPRTVSREIVPIKDLRLSLNRELLALSGRF